MVKQFNRKQPRRWNRRRSPRVLLRAAAAAVAILATIPLIASPASAADRSGDTGQAPGPATVSGYLSGGAPVAGDDGSQPPSGNLPELPELERDRQVAGLGGTATGELTVHAFSPAGCVGTTHNPHRSVVDAVVKGNTTCSVAVPALAIRTTLHRSRWYGWQQMADSGMRRNSGVRSINTNVRHNCQLTTHDWQGRTYHESLEPTGSYFAGTQKTERFPC